MSNREPLSTRVDQQTYDAVDRLRDDRGGDRSAAVRDALSAGLSDLGYLNDGRTHAQRIAGQVATALLAVGATLVALSLAGSLSLLVAGVGVCAGAFSTTVVGRYVIPRYEPGLSRRIPSIEVVTDE